MPSVSVFVSSNLSLNSANGTCGKSAPMLPIEECPKKKQGFTRLLLLTSAAVVLSCAIPTGYNIGVLNAPQQIIQAFCNETVYTKYNVVLSETQVSLLWSVVVSVFLIGGMVGSLAAGSLSNKFGRKGAILLVNSLGLIGAALFTSCHAASSVEILIFARILVGVYSGFQTGAVPMYLTEVAPASLRGPLGVLLPIGMGLGIVIAMVLGHDGIMGTEYLWPYLLGFFAIPIAVGTTLLVFCPESPKYLFIVKAHTDRAMHELCRLRGQPIGELDDDVLEMKKEVKQNLKSSSWSFGKVLTSRAIRPALLMLCLLHAANQLSGINAVFYYSTSIFNKAGLSKQESQYASIGAGITNFIIGAISAALVSRFGRKTLLLTSTVLAMFCLAGMTSSFVFMNAAPFVPYASIALLLSFVSVFGIGIGPIPFFIGSELFQPGPRPTAMSIGCTVNWLCNFLVGATFPTVQSFMGDYSFTIFIGFLFVIGLLIWRHLPETKDKDIEDIMAFFGDVTREKPAINCVEDACIIIPSTNEIAAV